MITTWLRPPFDVTISSIAETVPDTLEWIGALKNASLSPIFVPTFTVSPLATIGLQGGPMCCDIEMHTSLGSGSSTPGQFSVFLKCATCAPFSVFCKTLIFPYCLL